MPSTTTLARCAALGIAAGGRSTLGFAGPGLFPGARGSTGQTLRALGIAGELVVDKLPQTPSRLAGPGLSVRLASGAAGAIMLGRAARLPGKELVGGALTGVAGAAAGSYAGAAWRRWGAARRPDWHGAAIEDVVALALAYGACRRR